MCAGARFRSARSARTRPSTPRAPIDRDLALEIDERFEHRLLPAERCPTRARGSSLGADRAPAPCRRSRTRPSSARPDGRSRRSAGRRSASVATAANGVTGSPRSARNVFSRIRCCAISSARPLGRTIACSSAAAAAAGRHVLELERDDIDAARELADPIEIVVRRLHLDVRDLPGRRVVLGRERVHAIAEAARGHGEHAAELAAAQHADRRAGRNRLRSGSRERRRARPTSAISSRYACSFARSSGRDVARIATASRPALAAPAAPIATVATGTPFGICTIDSSESSPFSAALCTGTPITGRTVCAATMPGRCAAPPAPAMITSSPRSAAGRRVLGHPRRRAMRRHDRGIRAATPNSVRISSACRIVSQSDWLPMMTPTSGRALRSCAYFITAGVESVACSHRAARRRSSSHRCMAARGIAARAVACGAAAAAALERALHAVHAAERPARDPARGSQRADRHRERAGTTSARRASAPAAPASRTCSST